MIRRFCLEVLFFYFVFHPNIFRWLFFFFLMKNFPSLWYEWKYVWRKDHLKHVHACSTKLLWNWYLKWPCNRRWCVPAVFIVVLCQLHPKCYILLWFRKIQKCSWQNRWWKWISWGREVESRCHLQIILQKWACKSYLNLWRSTDVNGNIFPVFNQTLWDIIFWSLVKYWLEKHGLHFWRTVISYISITD